MKDFMKKKMYLILLVVSFSTLFSAILYADPIYCEYDWQCPEGMICVIPGNFCMEPAVITCTQEVHIGEIAYCYDTDYFKNTWEWCIWDGRQSVNCLSFF
jgi:hypothetical protein